MSPRQTPSDLLTPAVLHILLALAAEDLHGYGIQNHVEERTGGRLRLGPGTLYEAIHRLDDDGWIEELPGGGRKRVYRLTEAGRSAMRQELRRMEEIVEGARRADLLGDPAVP